MKLLLTPLLLAAVTAVAIPLAVPVAKAQATFSELDSSSRQSLDVTVFNGGLAVVRDRRSIVMPTGDVDLEFTEVAISIVPETVSLVSDRSDGFKANRQSYRYDLLNRQSLLERFVGRKVKYSRSILEEGNFEKFLREGILLSLNPEIVQFGDVIEVEPLGTISLPYIPDDLKTTPTLVFNGSNDREGEQLIDVRYHANNISWEADYAMTLEKKGSLDAWVTVRNHSGTAMAIDHLSLVAGDLNRTSHLPVPGPRAEAAVRMMSDQSAAVVPEAVGDYYIYDFEGGVGLLKNDTTQLRLMSATDIKYEREYRLISPVQRYVQSAEQEFNPGIWVRFENDKHNKLGRPLPAGIIRFYEARGDNAVFLGEAQLGHTPAGEELAVHIGQAFDLKASRQQTDYQRLGDRSAEATFNIELRNGGDKKQRIVIEEQLSGDWEIVEQSRRGKKRDANTYVFTADVPAEGSTELSYKVRMRW